MSEEQRMSDVDGFTIVYRKNRAPRIHLLRPYNSCNTERRKAGPDTVTVKGSREALMEVLDGKRISECLRCFPAPAEPDEPEVDSPVYADEIEG